MPDVRANSLMHWVSMRHYGSVFHVGYTIILYCGANKRTGQQAQEKKTRASVLAVEAIIISVCQSLGLFFAVSTVTLRGL